MNTPGARAWPGFREALGVWLRLGLLSFGGPAGQIAMMHTELVERRRWISERRFLHALNYCMLLPGPEAQQLATYMGWLLHRTRGGLAAGILFVLPSLLLLIGIAWVYVLYGQKPLLAAMFAGIKPAVAAIVWTAVWRLGSRTLTRRWLLAMAMLAFLLMTFLHLPFPWIVLLAALGGWGIARWAPAQLPHATPTARATVAEAAGAILIDDHTDVRHALFRKRKVLQSLAVGVGLWALPMGVLWWLAGPQHVLTQMALFFSQTALFTFGGAYAILPWVADQAVNRFGWMSPGQVIDGLALGEATPGPLIMVVVFIAFVGAWQSTALGVAEPWQVATAAALLVTWFTFLPSFVFILAGAPWVEHTRARLAFAGPLAAIGAAVTGVLLNLAVYFTRHVGWPAGRPDGLALALIAFWLLIQWQFKPAIHWVVLGGALTGLAWRAFPGT